ncbi:MAG: hypothetical protein GEV13_10660 [Rhodospirillales bacterium]|nr:hypothetical protein [Rhodospirillales bacterium]
MSVKNGGPPKGKSWTWLTRDMMESDAWLSLSPNAHRLIQFLMVEHMRHSSTANGKLLAPRRQLADLGIRRSSISDAIQQAVDLGFVDVRRGTGRAASTYSLTWYPLHDGTEPTNRWQTVVSVKTHQLHVSAKSLPLGARNGTHKPRSEYQNAPTRPVASAKTGVPKRHSPYREDSLRRSDNTDLNGADAGDAPALPLPDAGGRR